MKRSCEEEEENREVKQVKIYYSSSVDDEDSSSSSTENSSSLEEPCLCQPFIPTFREKQIVRKAMAIICRSNMSDWNCESDKRQMVLRENAVVFNANGKGFPCDIVVEVTYDDFYTRCRIIYSDSNGKEYNTMYTYWQSEFFGNYEEFDTISITKYINETSYFIFNNTVRQVSYFDPRNCDEDSWCYFADARSHIDRIIF